MSTFPIRVAKRVKLVERIETPTNVRVGDCLEVMETLPENSVDAVITDPPYHLTSIVERFGRDSAYYGDMFQRAKTSREDAYKRASKGFMGQKWDGGDIAFRPETWAKVFRVMKPGAYLAAFGGTRTYHRMACAIEDAGFEVRDQCQYLYCFGSGFPKSTNDGKGRGSGLKPANEPILVAQKPKDGSYADNDAKWGTGYMNIDDARVPLLGGEEVATNVDYTDERQADGWDTRRPITRKRGIGSRSRTVAEKPWTAKRGRQSAAGQLVGTDKPLSLNTEGSPLGRWPANIVHDGSEEVLSQLPDGAGRFFYTAKPSTREREEGCDGVSAGLNPLDSKESLSWRNGETKPQGHLPKEPRKKDWRMDKEWEPVMRHNTHPTLKPIALMRWLIRLLAPPGGIVLDPFLGSGTTAIAAHLEGRDWIGIERDENYAKIAEARIRHWMKKEGS